MRDNQQDRRVNTNAESVVKMNRLVWLGLGVVGGLVLASAIGVMVVNVIIPWEDVCAVLGPAQTLAEAGSRLLTQLQGWLTNAESFLTTIGSDEEVGEARTGLAGLIDQAKEVTSDMEAAIADVLTMPLQALIALAKVVLSAVQSSVEAAQNVMASIDAARCN